MSDKPRTVHADRPPWGIYDETLDPREWGWRPNSREEVEERERTQPGKRAAVR